MQTIRVLLVDDSPAFVHEAAGFLSETPGFEVVGWTSSGLEALDIVGRLPVDLVLMDIAMPGMNGLEATRRIKKRPEAPKVVILTLHDGLEFRTAALTAEADGFVAKSDLSAKLVPCVHALFHEGPDPRS